MPVSVFSGFTTSGWIAWTESLSLLGASAYAAECASAPTRRSLHYIIVNQTFL